MPARKPCIEHGCPRYARKGGSRCDAHHRAFERGRWDRGMTGRRGSRSGWRKRRLEAFRYRKGICFRCQKRIDVRERWECHHLNHDATDDRLENLAVAHYDCHREEHA